MTAVVNNVTSCEGSSPERWRCRAGLRVRNGRVALLREFVDTAAVNGLFQVGA